jgi:hypothetical protein
MRADLVRQALNDVRKIVWQETSVFEDIIDARIGMIFAAFAAQNV